MIYALPGHTFSASAEDFAPGLVGSLTVAIHGPGPAVYTAAATGGIYEFPAASGNYADDSLVAPTSAGSYRVYWRAPDGTDAVEDLIVALSLPVAPGAGPVGYPAAEDLQAISEVQALKELSAADLADVYAVAIKSIEDYCGQPFNQEVATRVIDGGGGRTVALDRRLAELTSLTVSGSSLAATDVGLNDDHSELSVLASAGTGNWVEQTLRDDQTPLFTSGVGTVTIEGIWGWLDTELPATDLTTPIARALRMDMEDQSLVRSGPLAETARTMARLRTDRLNEGPLTVHTSQSIVPLSTEVQALLSDFIWQPVARTT